MATAGTRPEGTPPHWGTAGSGHHLNRDSPTGTPNTPALAGALPQEEKHRSRRRRLETGPIPVGITPGGTGPLLLPAKCSASRRPNAQLGGHRPRAAPSPAPGRAPRSGLREQRPASRLCPQRGTHSASAGPQRPQVGEAGPDRTEPGRAGLREGALPAVAPRGGGGAPGVGGKAAPCPRCRVGSGHPPLYREVPVLGGFCSGTALC